VRLVHKSTFLLQLFLLLGLLFLLLLALDLLLLSLGHLDIVGPDAEVECPQLGHLARLTSKAPPLVGSLDLTHLAPAKVPLDALLAERVRTIVAAEQLAPVGAPPAVLVEAFLVLRPLPVEVELVALPAHRHRQVRVPHHRPLLLVVHLLEARRAHDRLCVELPLRDQVLLQVLHLFGWYFGKVILICDVFLFLLLFLLFSIFNDLF